jgi:hypothetical protein
VDRILELVEDGDREVLGGDRLADRRVEATRSRERFDAGLAPARR